MMRRFELLIGAIIISTAIIVGFWLIREASGGANTVPVIAYRSNTVAPLESMLCPGEELAYRQQVQVLDAPTVVRLVDTVWSVGEERTVVQDTTPQFYNYSTRGTVTLLGSYILPDLPAGAYIYRVSGTAESHDSAMFEVPFVVRSNCLS